MTTTKFLKRKICFKSIYQPIAVQNEWHSLRLALILLDFSINIHPSQNQVHRRGAEITEGYFLLIQSGDGDWIKSFFLRD